MTSAKGKVENEQKPEYQKSLMDVPGKVRHSHLFKQGKSFRQVPL